MGQAMVDSAQLIGKARQTRGDLGADVLGHAGIIAHLLMHGLAHNFQRPHRPSRNDSDRIVVLDEHGQLTDQGTWLDGLGLDAGGFPANTYGLPRDDDKSSIAGGAGAYDDLTRAEHDPL